MANFFERERIRESTVINIKINRCNESYIFKTFVVVVAVAILDLLHISRKKKEKERSQLRVLFGYRYHGINRIVILFHV